MLLSGLKKRSIADQKGNIEFNFSINSNSPTGTARVGISGTNVFNFTLKNGKVYDYQNRFVGSYEKGVPVSISGQLGQTAYDYYIDGDLVALGNSIGTGKYSWIYADADHEIDFDGYVKGVIPNYSLVTTGHYEYENFVVSGKIINNDPTRKFRIFDAKIDQSGSPYSILSFTTGDITGTGYIRLTSDQIGLNDSVVPVTLSTNFGQVPVNFIISGDHSVVPDIYLNISPDTVNVENNFAKDYTIQFASFPTGTQLGISLQYLSGITGNIYFMEDVVSPLISLPATGEITGSGILTKYNQGQVSGVDPKTLITEYGNASGYLKTATIYATGSTSQDYKIIIQGTAEGVFETDYIASGIHTGNYNGVVPLTGGYVNIVGYAFSGTGNTPGVATGIVPTGTGKILVFPTGCVSISEPLVYGEGDAGQFYSGILSVNKVYEGPIEIPYEILSVGWATGELLNGAVDLSFLANFEPGDYTFAKFYNGPVSGYGMNSGLFDPTGCLVLLPTSGKIGGYFRYNTLLDCSNLTGLPMMKITGYPSALYDNKGRLMDPHIVVEVKPSGGFGTGETSNHVLSGIETRTKTSRMGITSSGSGFFKNTITECVGIGELLNPIDPNAHLWKETMAATVKNTVYDSDKNQIGKVSTLMDLRGTGTHDDTLDFIGVDSGIMHFAISGSGKKTVALRGLNAEGIAGLNRTFEFYLYKDATPTHIWGVAASDVDPGYANPVSPWQKWRTTVRDGAGFDDTVIILDDLTSGVYSLYVLSQPTDAPHVYFKDYVFTGCEASKNVQITVCASGDFYEPIWFELTDYEELTAHSGVNYDPTYLVYTSGNLPRTGDKNTYVGGYLNPSTSEDGVSTYVFTIPIYENANFNTGHEFIIRLSNISGAGAYFSQQEAIVRIIDNEPPVVTGFLSGEGYYDPVNEISGDEITVNSGTKVWGKNASNVTGWFEVSSSGFVPLYSPYETGLDCTPIPPFVPDPPICWPLPEWECNQTGSCTGKCPERECCECEGAIVAEVSCPGYPGITFTGSYLPVGAICGSVSAAGCGSTEGSQFIGLVCSSHGSSLSTTEWINNVEESPCGSCTYSLSAYEDDCMNGPNGEPPCPENGGCEATAATWSGCIGENCYGDCTGDSPDDCGRVGKKGFCQDYAKVRRKKRPPGHPCKNELVFISVNCSRRYDYHLGCHDFGGGCPSYHSWSWKGVTKGRKSPKRQICPPPPPR